MPTGLKTTSSIIAIGFDANETVANTFVQSQIDLNLSPLDREVFVVLSINMDGESPDFTAAVDSSVLSSITSTSQTAVQLLSNSNCMAHSAKVIRAAGSVDGGVGFSTALETPPSNLDYIAIIATSDFFVQCQGFNNLSLKGVSGKMYGYRARANADIFAALVQSEVLSA
jgi:hypothetical protein